MRASSFAKMESSRRENVSLNPEGSLSGFSDLFLSSTSPQRTSTRRPVKGKSGRGKGKQEKDRPKTSFSHAAEPTSAFTPSSFAGTFQNEPSFSSGATLSFQEKTSEPFSVPRNTFPKSFTKDSGDSLFSATPPHPTQVPDENRSKFQTAEELPAQQQHDHDDNAKDPFIKNSLFSSTQSIPSFQSATPKGGIFSSSSKPSNVGFSLFAEKDSGQLRRKKKTASGSRERGLSPRHPSLDHGVQSSARTGPTQSHPPTSSSTSQRSGIRPGLFQEHQPSRGNFHSDTGGLFSSSLSSPPPSQANFSTVKGDKAPVPPFLQPSASNSVFTDALWRDPPKGKSTEGIGNAFAKMYVSDGYTEEKKGGGLFQRDIHR